MIDHNGFPDSIMKIFKIYELDPSVFHSATKWKRIELKQKWANIS